jgi:hypothetical protein
MACCRDREEPDKRIILPLHTEGRYLVKLDLTNELSIKVIIIAAFNDHSYPDCGTSVLIDLSKPPLPRRDKSELLGLRAKYARNIFQQGKFGVPGYSCITNGFLLSPVIKLYQNDVYLAFGFNRPEMPTRVVLNVFGYTKDGREELWEITLCH